MTVLREVDGNGKGSMLTFLPGAGLIGAENPAILLSDADLRKANLEGAKFKGVDLRVARLQDAKVTDKQLADALSLQGATMPDGSKHP